MTARRSLMSPFVRAPLLAALAAETSTIRLASNVTQMPLRSPGVLAHQAVTVDHISGGRIELGIGTGSGIDPGTEMIGLLNWPNGERVSRLVTTASHPRRRQGRRSESSKMIT